MKSWNDEDWGEEMEWCVLVEGCRIEEGQNGAKSRAEGGA